MRFCNIFFLGIAKGYFFCRKHLINGLQLICINSRRNLWITDMVSLPPTISYNFPENCLLPTFDVRRKKDIILFFKSSSSSNQCFSISDSKVITLFIFSFKSCLYLVSTSPCLRKITSNIASFIFPLMPMSIKKSLQLASKCLVHLSNEHLLKHFKQAAVKSGSPSVII